VPYPRSAVVHLVPSQVEALQVPKLHLEKKTCWRRKTAERERESKRNSEWHKLERALPFAAN